MMSRSIIVLVLGVVGAGAPAFVPAFFPTFCISFDLVVGGAIVAKTPRRE